MTRYLRCFDNPGALIALIVTVLLSVGLVTVYSASGARAGLENYQAAARAEAREGTGREIIFQHGDDYVRKQLMWTLIALAAAAFVFKLPIEQLEKWSPWVLCASMVLLVMVIATPLGVESKGARRWLRLGGMTLQPSEFAKVAMVLFMAKFLADKRDKIRNLKEGFIPAAGITAVFLGLIVLEKDLGTIILMGTVILGMWGLAQVRLTHLATIVIGAMPVIVFLVFQQSYRVHRILAFLHPEKYTMTHGYQLNQSLIAVGSGGTFGAGLGSGMQKYHFLSESHTDFVYAIVCEELGMVGGVAVALLFLAFILIGLRISYRAPDYFAGLAAAGLTMIIGWAAFINFFVVLGLAPTKGLALPFFSYGGSSLVTSLVSVGLLMNIANYSASVAAGGREAL